MKLVSYLVVFTFLLAACSTSKSKSGESMAEGSAEMMESGSDEVGSAPEDLLADETGGEQGEASGDADPFADLKNDSDMSTEFQGEESSAPAPSTEVAEVDALYGNSADSGSGSMDVYTVQAGDTLMKIAFSIYGDLSRWKDLFEMNRDKLTNANILHRGMQLKFEAPSVPFQRVSHSHSYVIKKGDTLANIADEIYGRRKKYRKLQNYNQNLIKDPHKIFAGFTIFYEITQQEMAEAEARRREKMAMQSGGMGDSSIVRSETIRPEPIPSAANPPAEVKEQPNPVRVPVATTPPQTVAPAEVAPLPPTAPGR